MLTNGRCCVRLKESDPMSFPGHPLGQRIAGQEGFGAGMRSPSIGRTVFEHQSSYYNQQSSSNSTGYNKFRVCLDVRHFSAQELEVKTTEQHVIVHGKHDEKEDEFGLVEREFTRRYPLPKEVDPETVTSSLTTDGVLVIEAPKKYS